MSEPQERLLDRVTKRAAIMRTWGVDESKVDYNAPLGDAWLLVHLGDMLTTATEQIAAKDRKLSEMTEMYAEAARDAEAAEQRLAEVEAERDTLKAAVDEYASVCVCGCPIDDHESYGEDGWCCEHDDHECHYTSKAVAAVVASLKSEQERLREALRRLMKEAAAVDALGGLELRGIIGNTNLRVFRTRIEEAALLLSGIEHPHTDHA